MLYPSHFEQKIAFTTIRQLIKDKCISALGVEQVDAIRFSSDYVEVMQLLDLADEMYRVVFTEPEELPVGDFFDLRQSLSRIRVEGMFLDEAEVFDLRRALDAVRRIISFFQQLDTDLYPHLMAAVGDIPSFAAIIREIDIILNKFGKIKDNASPELARIRKELTVVQSGISRSLAGILRQAQADGYVDKDAVPTLRDGRLVIPVSPAYKRKVGGIVHDESATGKTVFIEPAQVVEANNRIRELESEERREVIRILVEFTNFVRPHYDDMILAQEFLGTVDFLRAKALFAEEIQAIKPRLDNVCQLEWTKAIHPILFLSLRKQGKEVVPLEIVLNEKQRILLISGPNAGGKSVCLKTVVLLQYMLQCGLMVPLHGSSRAGVFERMFIDIGDEQSLENDLSTYSSHLTNMKYFIKHSNDKTLLLIDEFGTGTEPMIGGAIAEATLERFNRNRAFGVITTHYTNLKHYADAAQGVVNGAMLYDRQHLQPLFQLQIGNPGSSFAVEIARKIGLPEDLIQDASDKVGAEHLDYDKHLQDIVRDKRYWENKRQQIRQKEKRVEELVAKYESELEDMNRKRKEVNIQAKSEAQQLLKEANAKIENTIREIKESQAEKERTQLVRKELEEFKKKISPKPVAKPELKKPVNTINNTSLAMVVGAHVRVQGQQATGVILELQDKQALVAFGNLKSTIKLSKLEVVSKNQIKKEAGKYDSLKATAATDEVRQRKLNFSSDIDVRGMRGDEALQAVMYFIDDAVMVGVTGVRILHGTGTGILRQLIRQYLNTVPSVKSFRDEHVQLGGAGITVVELE
jgi:DNA mismatch repair protein MutS2